MADGDEDLAEQDRHESPPEPGAGEGVPARKRITMKGVLYGLGAFLGVVTSTIAIVQFVDFDKWFAATFEQEVRTAAERDDFIRFVLDQSRGDWVRFKEVQFDRDLGDFVTRETEDGSLRRPPYIRFTTERCPNVSGSTHIRFFLYDVDDRHFGHLDSQTVLLEGYFEMDGVRGTGEKPYCWVDLEVRE